MEDVHSQVSGLNPLGWIKMMHVPWMMVFEGSSKQWVTEEQLGSRVQRKKQLNVEIH